MTVIPFRPQLAPAPLPLRKNDQRNGEVYACEYILTTYVDGREVETPDGFMWIHISRSGTSAYSENGFETLAAAEIAGQQRALNKGAVFVRSIEVGSQS
jgi:hypothetical protein